MDFTYESYLHLISLLREKEYNFCNYDNYNSNNKAVIIRHDVDLSLLKALKMAQIESINGVQATYFILLSTNFYNIFSKESKEILDTILGFGHEIGLHFDEKKYSISNAKDLEYWIRKEAEMLEGSVERPIDKVSMHRPSKWLLDKDIKFAKFINTYSAEFILDFKYLSDSRMYWRENVLDIISSKNFDKLHILTHPFWYSEEKETIQYKIASFISMAKEERFLSLNDNLRDLKQIIEGGQ